MILCVIQSHWFLVDFLLRWSVSCCKWGVPYYYCVVISEVLYVCYCFIYLDAIIEGHKYLQLLDLLVGGTPLLWCHALLHLFSVFGLKYSLSDISTICMIDISPSSHFQSKVSLGLKWVSYGQHIYGLIILSILTPCFLVGGFGPFTLRVISVRYEFSAPFLLVLLLFLEIFSFPL